MPVERYDVKTRVLVNCEGCKRPIKVGTKCSVLIRYIDSVYGLMDGEEDERYVAMSLYASQMELKVEFGENAPHPTIILKPEWDATDPAEEYKFETPPTIEFRHRTGCGVDSRLYRKTDGSYGSGKRQR